MAPKKNPAQPSAKRRKGNGEPQAIEQYNGEMRRTLSTSLQTRALKACTYCRKQKTRCFKASPFAVSCLRCLGSERECSLEEEYKRENPEVKVVQGVPEHFVGQETVGDGSSPLEFLTRPFPTHIRPYADDMKTRLDGIYLGVSELLALVKNGTKTDGDSSTLNSDARLFLDATSSMRRSPAPPTLALMSGTRSNSPGPSPLPNKAGYFSHSGSSAGQRPQLQNMEELGVNEEDPYGFMLPSNSFQSAPLTVIARQVRDVPRPILNLLQLTNIENPTSRRFFDVEKDVISGGILTEPEVVDLINDFRSNYGRWVLFPLYMATDELIVQIRKRSSLLLTTCCCLSLRYLLNGKPSPGDVDSFRRKKDTYKLIMQQLVTDLDKSLLKFVAFLGTAENLGDVEFFQAIVILSIYLMSLSSIINDTIDPDTLLETDLALRELNLDPWYLSGLGLSAFISKTSFGTLFSDRLTVSDKQKETFLSDFSIWRGQFESTEDQMLTILRIYNHLILIHLVSCIFSGRMCIVDEIRLNHCIASLSLPNATNFDGRMVSEISILLITYNFVQLNLNSGTSKVFSNVESNFQVVKDEINSWLEQWGYLFSQPALQFVEFCYHFCYTLIYYNYTYAKVFITSVSSPMMDFSQSTVDQILLHGDKEIWLGIMSHTCSLAKIILTVKDDSYFAYLSDQIHFCSFFGGLMLIKTLHFLKTNDKLHYLNDPDLLSKGMSEATWRAPLEYVKLLIGKYTRVAQENEHDILTKYRNGLVECLKSLFPDFPIDQS